METVKLSLYEKNKETGILENLLGAYFIEENLVLLDKAYVINEGQLKLHLYLTVDGEIGDEEYEAIYDNYSGEAFDPMDLSIEEVEDGYNPTWLFILDFVHDIDEMESTISEILSLHKKELTRVLENIKNM